MSVINDPAQIEAYRRKVILRGLKLEVQTGMRHSHGSVVQAARVLLFNLTGNGGPRTKKGLLAELERVLSSEVTR